MRQSSGLVLLAALITAGCQAPRGRQAGALEQADVVGIRDSVRAFVAAVAQGVTAQGPGAWRGFFADEPAFFMASDGQLVFPSYDSASRAIAGVIQVMPHIELRWGDVRVDPLAPGLAVVAAPYQETQVDPQGRRHDEAGFFTGVAEHRAAGWQFRDAHWSATRPPASAR